MSERLGLFGGTFDPVHNAHLALARSALDACSLDAVLWIPAGQQPQKSRPLTPAEHREAMVRLAIAGEPRFVLERCELERGGSSYTIDTVRALQAARPQAAYTLIIGGDQYAHLHTWKQWQELLGRVGLAIAQRPDEPPPINPQVQAHPHRMLPLPMHEISSTDIRDRAARGEPYAHLVPSQVARYIDQHGLYREADPPSPGAAAPATRS